MWLFIFLLVLRIEEGEGEEEWGWSKGRKGSSFLEDQSELDQWREQNGVMYCTTQAYAPSLTKKFLRA